MMMKLFTGSHDVNPIHSHQLLFIIMFFFFSIFLIFDKRNPGGGDGRVLHKKTLCVSPKLVETSAF